MGSEFGCEQAPACGTRTGVSAQPSQPWTVLRLLDWTREYFETAGVDQPRLAAEVLLAHALQCQRIELYARFNHQPDEQCRASFRKLVKQAAEHRPIAYLVGGKEFYSLRFKVTPDVLIPRPETEILVAEAIRHLRAPGRPAAIWDVCTGCGCVAVAVASQVPDVTVLATDVSEAALAVAAENAAVHGAAGRVQVGKADLLTLPEDWHGPQAFDAITANPPYVAEGDPVGESVKHEPRLALYAGRDGLDFIRPMVAAAPGFLASGGALIMEFGYRQGGAVRALIAETGAFGEPKVLMDHQAIERAVVAVRR